MIHDLALEEHQGSLDFDIVVIGSGPAASVLVSELVRRLCVPVKIAVLESGRHKCSPYADGLREVTWDRMPIKPHSRQRVLGGASTTWSGLAAPLDAIDMEDRPWLPAPGWPLTLNDLEPYYAIASEHYGFAPFDMFRLDAPQDRKPGMWQALRAAGEWRPQWQKLTEKLFLAAVPPQNFGTRLRKICAAENVELFLDASVKKLEVSETGGPCTITAAVVKTSTERNVTVSGRCFVLCAGGIENARLLFNSRKPDGTAVGNEHDQLGRCMMNHPKNYYGIVSLEKPLYFLPYYFGCMRGGFSGFGGVRLNDEAQRQQQLVNCCVRFEPMFPWSDNPGVECLLHAVKQAMKTLHEWRAPRSGKVVELRSYAETGDDSTLNIAPRSMLSMIGIILRHLPGVLHYSWYRVLKRPAIRKVRICNFMEMEPSPDNRITLGNKTDSHGYPVAHVSYDTTERDRRSMRLLTETLASELKRAKLGTLAAELMKMDDDVSIISLDASHHMGGTRMGADPKKSVVDASHRVHSTTNLYVAGSSVFSTSGCANPTYTIVALSARLAEILAHRIGGAAIHREKKTMATKSVVVIGAGERVCDAVLPVITAPGSCFSLAGVYSRSARGICDRNGKAHSVQALSTLNSQSLKGVDLVYIGVLPEAVPDVVQQIARASTAPVDLLIDTPVLRALDLGVFKRFGAFRNVWAAEDVIALPWLPAIEAARSHYKLGSVRDVLLDRSGYNYHGIALAKTLLGESQSTSASRGPGNPAGVRQPGSHSINFSFPRNKRATILYPRDYSAGSILLGFEGGQISDRRDFAGYRLEGVASDGRWIGFRVGDVIAHLEDSEVELFGPLTGEELNASVTNHMHRCKRVGLSRLFRRIAAGEGAYPVLDCLDDMWIDYVSSAVGRWRNTPFTSARSGLCRGLVGTLRTSTQTARRLLRR